MLYAVEEINATGGVLGRKIEVVTEDPASDWDLFAEKARKMISQDKVSVIFGCWTSVSRKSVLPVFEEYNHLLFYPVQYEGEECSKNVFYTGAAVNQQAAPAVQYLLDEGFTRFYLLGTDYVYPRTTNKILKAMLEAKGVSEDDYREVYTPFHHQDYQSIVAEIKEFAAAGDACVVSTVNGDSNVPFYKEFANQGLTADDVPIMAFSVAEDELRGMDTSALVGHLAAWNYFMSVDAEISEAFIDNWLKFIGDDKRVTNDPMEAHYIGFNMWVEAVKKAGTTDATAVQEAIIGVSVPNLSGGLASMMPNHHITKPVLIGEIQADGQFDIVWQTSGTVVGDAWSDFLSTSRDITADWMPPLSCGNYNVKTGKCSGQNYE